MSMWRKPVTPADFERMREEHEAALLQLARVVAQRDEARALARKMARKMARFAILVAPLQAHRCIFCDAIGRYVLGSESYAKMEHAPDCPERVIQSWEREP